MSACEHGRKPPPACPLCADQARRDTHRKRVRVHEPTGAVSFGLDEFYANREYPAGEPEKVRRIKR